MRKLDFIIIISVLLIAAGTFFFNSFINFPMKDSSRVSVVSEGEEIYSLALPDIPMEIALENRYGRNTLRLTREGAEVIYASCETQMCVHTGRITNSRQVIACLPHRLIITLSGVEQDNDVDAIVR